MTDKVDFSKPVQTRDGRTVRILCTDANGCEPIVGIVVDGAHCGYAEHWDADGNYDGQQVDGHNRDLINVPDQEPGVLVKFENDITNKCNQYADEKFKKAYELFVELSEELGKLKTLERQAGGEYIYVNIYRNFQYGTNFSSVHNTLDDAESEKRILSKYWQLLKTVKIGVP